MPLPIRNSGRILNPKYNHIRVKVVDTAELKTRIFHALHTTDDSSCYTSFCKCALSEKAITVCIMKACLAEYQDCDVNDIADKYATSVSNSNSAG